MTTRFIYTIAIRCYGLLIWAAQPFSVKARKWIRGRMDQKRSWEDLAIQKVPVVWIHCASLGEFEQGRPLIEHIRSSGKAQKIILTFFSPSGYEVRKNYSEVDAVFYLPLDTPENAKKFIEKINPDSVFFIKYDFWFNFLYELAEKGIPYFFVSVILRKEHFLLKNFSAPLFKYVGGAAHIFVQDSSTYELLSSRNCKVMLTGDTRIDRVLQLQKDLKKYPQVQKLAKNKEVMVIGSCWDEDLAVILDGINSILKRDEYFVIVAPHDVAESMLKSIENKLIGDGIRLSRSHSGTCADYLTVDTIGDLAHLYPLASLAYIGGGFGKGIHSILEPIGAQVPVIFGPNFSKFWEARELIRIGAARYIENSVEFDNAVNYFKNTENQADAVAAIRLFFGEHRGATAKIMHYLEEQNIF